MNAVEAFEQAYARLHELQRKQLADKHLIYCLCGREFPDGRVERILYGSVHYAENRCVHCSEVKP